MPDFHFKEDAHEYYLGGRRLWGTTEILDREGFIPSFAKQEYAALRGLYVHKACELLAWDNLDWATVHPEILGYVLSCAEYFAHTHFEPRRTEHRFYHPQYLYAGTWDLDGGNDAANDFLCDYKAGAPASWHCLQTAAYQEGARANGIPIRKRGTLYLQQDGSMAKLKLHSDRGDWNVFLSALNVCNARERR